MTKRAAPVLLALLMLGACSGSQQPGAPGDDKFAGLDGEITAWRADLLKTTKACAEAPSGKACEIFEVACKGELPITSAETAKGVTAKVVVAMTFNGWEPRTEEFKPTSAFARFARGKSGWTRSETAPVNLSTCAAAA